METMEIHRGRLIDHVQLNVKDLEASRKFYRAVLAALGRKLTYEHKEGGFFVADELFVAVADDPSKITATHIAFQTKSREEVKRAYEAGLQAGGKDNGAPGLREYHPTYYGAFVLDPDGNNIEAVYHGEHERSADDVIIRFQV